MTYILCAPGKVRCFRYNLNVRTHFLCGALVRHRLFQPRRFNFQFDIVTHLGAYLHIFPVLSFVAFSALVCSFRSFFLSYFVSSLSFVLSFVRSFFLPFFLYFLFLFLLSWFPVLSSFFLSSCVSFFLFRF